VSIRVKETRFLRDDAYQQIKRSIITGQYEPGTVLYETVLSKEMGMSRTPIREALMLLSKEDLVKALPNGGVLVATATLEEINEIFDLRLCLERYVVEEIFSRQLRVDVTELRKIYARQAKAYEENDVWEFFDANRAFHIEFVTLLGNKTLASVMEGLRDKPIQSGFRALRNKANLEEALGEHETIISALEAGDEDLLMEEVAKHVANARRRLFSR